MSSRDNDIDKLFSKKFERFEVKPSEEEWRSLSPKLGRYNFLKFSFVTLNIYYLIIITALAGTVTYSGIKNIELTKKVHNLEQRLTAKQQQNEESINQATPSIDATGKNEPKVINNQNSINKPSIPVPESKVKPMEPSSKTEEKILPVPNNEIKDTAHFTSQPVLKPDSLTNNRIRKIKKTLVVKPKVVIVKKDTVVITKPHK